MHVLELKLPVLNQKANDIAGMLVKTGVLPEKAAFDPTFIIMIMEIIMTIFQNCKKKNSPEELLNNLKNPTTFTRWVIKRAAKNRLDDGDMFKCCGKELSDCCVESGKVSTLDEVKLVLTETELVSLEDLNML